MNWISMILCVLLMWVTRKHHRDDYDIMADDYDRAVEMGLWEAV